MKRIPPDGATARSRSLRADMTDAERKVWTMLRSAFPDWRFHRQVPFRQYIADFASHRARLVIEVDGGRMTQQATRRERLSSKQTAIASFASGTMMC